MHQSKSPSRNATKSDRAKSAVELFLVMVLTAFAGNALAWGKDAHHVVAKIAASQLTPRAQAQVDRLLAMEPGQTFASISTWADEHRNPATAAWHYLNFPRGTCVYEAERDCPDGKCVVGAINRQLEILATNGDDDMRLKALKYVVHFVADIHQPLHAGISDDRGGNSYQVQFGGRGTNLHAIWDSGLMRGLIEDSEAMVQRLMATHGSVPASDLSVISAAKESCKIVSGPDFYPGRHVGREYSDQFVPLMEKRLVLAGRRLAGLLNRALK